MADYFFRYFLFLFLFITSRLGVEGTNDECKITKCGENGSPIRFPFRHKPDQPKHCGYPGLELSCNRMNQTVLELPVALEVVVDEIDYILQIIYVHDPHNYFPAQIHNFSSVPIDLFEYLQSDLQLSWSKPNCSMCKSKGKICSWKNYNTTTAAAAAAGEPELECVKMPKKPTGEELGIKIEEEEHAQIAKKLTIVGLCCIQWSPLDRPPMKIVVQMLEGKGDMLAMPPNPSASVGRHESSKKPARAINIELEVISEV
ncbi:hypothetical protein LguiA_029805 [Lonicera macranthoides]